MLYICRTCSNMSDDLNGSVASPTNNNGINGSKAYLRRCKSVTRAEEIQSQEAKARRSQPDRPCHRPRDSLFTWSSGFDNFTGFVNWAFLLLCMGGLRLFLENLLKYGSRVDPIEWFRFLSGAGQGSADHPSLILILYSVVPVVICLLIEKGLSVEIIGHKLGMMSHISNIFLLVLLPMIVINVKGPDFSLIGGTVVCFTYSILFLKLWSYVQVNLWCRNKRKFAKTTASKRLRRQSLSLGQYDSSDDLGINADTDHHDMPIIMKKKKENGSSVQLVQYPDNLNLKDLAYYIFAPTLCYELNFPRTNRIRKRFLFKRIVEVFVGCQVMMSLYQQWIIPSVKNSLVPFSHIFQRNDFTLAIERLLKLAIPNHLVWLIFFYLTFHSFLNLLGELLHFADRHFYYDWWNANNIDVFWRKWNLPVHKWAVRHLYIPMVDIGYNRIVASTTVFFISAFFHEYLVSVPLRTFKIWAFMGMMAQLPLSYFSKFMEQQLGPRWGNVVVWASLILGQPLCIMMYYHDYIVTHFGEELIESYSHNRTPHWSNAVAFHLCAGSEKVRYQGRNMSEVVAMGIVNTMCRDEENPVVTKKQKLEPAFAEGSSSSLSADSSFADTGVACQCSIEATMEPDDTSILVALHFPDKQYDGEVEEQQTAEKYK
ncbi:Hypothetical predicted protein [Cloeon dipterum]|uniref:O-acyltransferase n=1 Tax=Cloeon dipterum TaxID=197152 RepID=A0A8S1CKR6_9INSE|nr:Hypothetical predicted protein [Cloeon dipterum]